MNARRYAMANTPYMGYLLMSGRVFMHKAEAARCKVVQLSRTLNEEQMSASRTRMRRHQRAAELYEALVAETYDYESKRVSQVSVTVIDRRTGIKDQRKFGRHTEVTR